ncbi:Dynein 8 kDa light chain, flagellar outer arm [Holothuria leucospilota]|uniref:Dynein light chain n=1 Tax=Holothuria leucospilota TaxID=206669 RepID=A0A9Q1C971_HOLLE|nr:Dynein 8 kDa light chain, flagellar outer arm [Holothuria leucospilota]
MSHSTTTYSYSAKTTSGGSSFDRFGTAEKDVNSSVGKITVKNSDMEGEMKQDAIDLTEDAFKQFTVEKDIAAHIKKEFDRKHGNSWHCIVGRNYGSYVTHETGHFIYLYVKQVAVLLFKSG